ncbi:MAG: hypothetical protein COU52_00220 [Candidatus Omnitrophica bacterium CG10_big_fil_rev_8_21_14_0_10_43_8]|nr:MAG: hypothetical protein COU52_00220 [Candidatus Omnitrophica bacterium CG10_big_fil_rev_8_21_14_0_10_43_8]
MLFKKNPEIAVIDFSNNWLKLALPDKTYVAQFNLDINNKASRREFARLVWGFLKSNPKTVYSCLPRQFVTVRFLRLPSVNESEIEKMLEFEAIKQLPFSGQDIVTGHITLSADEKGYSRVMLAAAQKDVIEKHQQILKAIGIAPDKLCLSTEAVLNFFLFTSRINQDQKTLYLLVDVDSASTELIISRGRDILFTRSFSHGAIALYDSGALTRVRQWADTLKEHIKLSYVAFKKEYTATDVKVAKIVVTGGVSKFFSQIDNNLSKEFGVSVEFLDARQQASHDKPVSLTAVLGVALSADKIKMNLLPQEIKLATERKKEKSEIFKFYSLVFAILCCIIIVIGGRFLCKQLYINHLGRQLAQLKPYAQKAAALSDKIKIIRRQSGEGDTALGMLAELYAIIPNGLKISNFSLNDDGSIVLRGNCDSMALIFSAVSALEASENFKNAKLVSANKRRIAQAETVDFNINCILKH